VASPLLTRSSAQQHLCSNEESQEVTSGEYGDCHTVGTVLKIFQKILFEEVSKTCHVSMFRGIPTFDKTSAQQRLCFHEESQRARSGEYGDCHTVG
jgi:hypothetical protein